MFGKESRIAEIRGQLDALEILSQFSFFQSDEKLLKEKKELEEELERLKRDWEG